MSTLMPRIDFKATTLFLITLLFAVDLALAKKSSNSVITSDPGFLFQDEVTKEIVVDVHRDQTKAKNPFEDLAGKFQPDSIEYRALLLAAGISVDAVGKVDENFDVKSLKILREKFDEELAKLKSTSNESKTVKRDPELEEAAPAVAPTVFSFSEVSEAGFADPILGEYRLIPLERGLMMAGVSGEKRVFTNGNVLKDDVFKVAIGDTGKGERVLAILHQAQADEPQVDMKFTVWVVELTDNRIGWTKTLEFSNSKAPDRSVAGGSATGQVASQAASLGSLMTLSGETVSIAVGGNTKTLALKSGEIATAVKQDAQAAESLTPATEN